MRYPIKDKFWGWRMDPFEVFAYCDSKENQPQLTLTLTYEFTTFRCCNRNTSNMAFIIANRITSLSPPVICSSVRKMRKKSLQC